MKIKSGIFLLSVGLCITVGNMAQAADPTREGIASIFVPNTFQPILGGDIPLLGYRSLKVQCPKNGFLVARADALFSLHIPAKLPGFAFVDFSITRGDEEFDTENSPSRGIFVPFSQASEELRTSFPQQSQPGSIQRVDGCEKGDEFSYAFNVRASGTAEQGELIVSIQEAILVVEFFEKSIQIEDGQDNNGQDNQ